MFFFFACHKCQKNSQTSCVFTFLTGISYSYFFTTYLEITIEKSLFFIPPPPLPPPQKKKHTQKKNDFFFFPKPYFSRPKFFKNFWSRKIGFWKKKKVAFFLVFFFFGIKKIFFPFSKASSGNRMLLQNFSGLSAWILLKKLCFCIVKDMVASLECCYLFFFLLLFFLFLERICFLDCFFYFHFILGKLTSKLVKVFCKPIKKITLMGVKVAGFIIFPLNYRRGLLFFLTIVKR